MALEYAHNPATGILRIVGSGIVSIENRMEFIRNLLGREGMPKEADVLMLVEEVRNPPTAEEVPMIAMMVEWVQRRFQGRAAIVNTTVGHITLSHLVAVSVREEFGSVRVFGSEEMAMEWLRSR